jgi:N-acetylneuraminic acid mutarotase
VKMPAVTGMIGFPGHWQCFIKNRKKHKMKNVLVYSLALVIATAPLLINTACNKSSSSSSDLVGNWAISDYFDGPARSEAVLFQIADTVFVGTGLSDNKRFADFWKYSLDKRYWTKIKDFGGGPRSSGVAFALGKFGYVGTGYDNQVNYTNDMWQYSVDSNGWAPRNNFGGTARVDAVAFVANGNAYIATGYDDNYLKDVWQYNQASDTWSQKAGISGSKRREAATFTIGGKVYLISGNNNGTPLNDLQSYDPATDTWTALRKLTNTSDDSYDDKYTTIVRFNAATFVIDGKGYLATGEAAGLNTKTWEYDPAADQWTEKTSFSGTARTGALGFTLANRGFIMAGRSGSASFDNMFELQPTVADVTTDNQ